MSIYIHIYIYLCVFRRKCNQIERGKVRLHNRQAVILLFEWYFSSKKKHNLRVKHWLGFTNTFLPNNSTKLHTEVNCFEGNLHISICTAIECMCVSVHLGSSLRLGNDVSKGIRAGVVVLCIQKLKVTNDAWKLQ